MPDTLPLGACQGTRAECRICELSVPDVAKSPQNARKQVLPACELASLSPVHEDGIPDSPPEEYRHRRHWVLPLRMLLAGLLITALTGGAVATAGLMQLKEIETEIKTYGHEATFRKGTVTPTKPGKPQTILLVGSDRRFGDGKKDARSDTMMLVRIDPEQSAITVLSVPRDLAVDIPGRGLAKINESYSLGGLDLTARTLKDLLGTPEERFHINHAVATTFGGFVGAINHIGCVYVDVDRRYYHTNAGLAPGQHWAEIDVRAGYQQLCGTDALAYVRFRHLDNDIVRAARQQDFLRAAKDQLREQGVLSNLRPLARIFAKATETDGDLQTSRGILRLAKLAVAASGKPVREVHFPATFVAHGDSYEPGTASLGDYVTATPDQIHRAVREFMHPSPPKPFVRAHRARKRAAAAPMKDALAEGKALVKAAPSRKATRMPVFVPAEITQKGSYATNTEIAPNPRRYVLRGPKGKRFAAYRLVLVEDQQQGQYYGVQGTTWRKPPLLAGSHQNRRIGDRLYSLYTNGKRLRLVAWSTPKGVYWVSNTLSLDLSNSEMLALASSARKVTRR
jgi:polyisoprenyl-teichoic acid--peptidoglycan teichoic acid transferase